MKLKLSVLFIVTIFLSGIASASFSVDKNSSSVVPRYFGGDFISGNLNISFNEQDGNSSFESNLGGSVKLIDILKKSGFVAGTNFFCSPSSCKNDYSTDGSLGQNIINFNLEEKIVYGFVLRGEEVKVEALNFEIYGGDGASCRNQIFIDYFDDGKVDFYNDRYAENTFCADKNFGCYNGDGIVRNVSLPKYSIGSNNKQICEKMTLPPAAGYKIGAKVYGDGDSRKVGVWLLNLNGTTACGSMSGESKEPSNGEVSAIAKCSFLQEFTGMVCVFDDDSSGGASKYKINYEEDSNACGMKIESRRVENVSVDYEIFAQPLAYSGVGWVDAATTYLSKNGKSLREDADKYILERYNRKCTDNCYIPVSLWRGYVYDRGLITNVTIQTTSSKRLEYETGDLPATPEEKISHLSEGSFKISSNFMVLEIGKMNFAVPESNGSRNFEISLDGENVLNEDINIEFGYNFSISPRFALIRIPTIFTVNSPENITKTEWNFGDGSSLIIENGKSVSHSFSDEGTYLAQVKVTNERGISSTKRFKIVVGEPKISASILVNEYGARIENIKRDIDESPEWTKGLLKKEMKLDEQENKLGAVDNKLKTFTSATPEDKYVEVINEIIALDIPLGIFTSESGTIPGEIGLNTIDVMPLAKLSNYKINSSSDTKDAVVQWIIQNYGFDIKFETISAREEESDRKILRTYEVELTKRPTASVDNSYIIINYPKNSVVLKTNYNVREIGDGDALAIPVDGNGNPNKIEFAIGGVNAPSVETLGLYISPIISDLGVVDKTYGGFRNDVNEFLWGRFFISMILLIVVFFSLYIFIQTWYKKYYENYLFKNGNDLYNLINYMYNSRKSGLDDKEIKNKLGGRNWKGEQISYAFKKIDGKRTGMFEIPLFKSFENRRVKREIENRQGRAIDARFVMQRKSPITNMRSKSSGTKNIPVGVKLIALLAWLSAIGGVFAGLGLFFVSSIFSSIGGIFGIIGKYSIAGGIMFLILGIVFVFIGIGLWKGRNWARILEIIFSLASVLVSLFLIIYSIKSLTVFLIVEILGGVLVNGGIVYYLLFNRNTKEIFNKASEPATLSQRTQLVDKRKIY